MSSNSQDLRAVALPPEQRRHPGLTIAVYKVNERGERTTVQPKRSIPAANRPLTGYWSFCACRRCRVGEPIR